MVSKSAKFQWARLTSASLWIYILISEHMPLCHFTKPADDSFPIGSLVHGCEQSREDTLPPATLWLFSSMGSSYTLHHNLRHNPFSFHSFLSIYSMPNELVQWAMSTLEVLDRNLNSQTNNRAANFLLKLLWCQSICILTPKCLPKHLLTASLENAHIPLGLLLLLWKSISSARQRNRWILPSYGEVGWKRRV